VSGTAKIAHKTMHVSLVFLRFQNILRIFNLSKDSIVLNKNKITE
jgi:hypothetical protein